VPNPSKRALNHSSLTVTDDIRWSSRDLVSPVFKRAAALFAEALTVREVAATLRISKSEAGRLRVRVLNDGLIVDQTSVQ
jgi:hypothetical protein